VTTTRGIWIDLDNTPHVPFFRPIIRELEARGENVHVTAREAFQVCELADLLGVRYQKVGRHYGKNRFLKVWGLLWRSMQLLPIALRHRPALALSHGSRSQIFLCNLLRIPTLMIMDYEYAKTPFLLRPRWQIVPEVLRHERLQCSDKARILTYQGIKEDVYAHDFKADDSLLATLGLNKRNIIITVRPPASEAHYHHGESDTLFVAFMDRACSKDQIQIVLLPRNKKQEEHYRRQWPSWFNCGSVMVPAKAVDGLNLLWHSDLVVSGGGTMNREAAALGIPVYSIFRGPMGSLDKQLQRENRLTLIANTEDLRDKIIIQKRQCGERLLSHSPIATIIKHIDMIRAQEFHLQPKREPREA
jgi:predicted glycosyltransferase